MNGRNTTLAGVVGITTADGRKLRVTSLERSLIDATVRPVYSGGVSQVIRAFAAAAPRVSVNKLTTLGPARSAG